MIKRLISVKVSLIAFLAGIVLLPMGFISIALSVQNDAFLFSGEPIRAYWGGLCIAVGAGAWLTSMITGLLQVRKRPIVLLWVTPLAALLGVFILKLIEAFGR